MYYQQGDVLLKKISKLPEGLEKVEGKVLQHGEFTGHRHQFDGNAAVDIFVDTSFVAKDKAITHNEGKYIVVGDYALLLHEEHKPITVEPGIYEIDIVREFDYDTMEAARVRD